MVSTIDRRHSIASWSRRSVHGTRLTHQAKRARYSHGNLTQHTRDLDLDREIDEADDDLSEDDYDHMVWNAANGYDDSLFDDAQLVNLYDRTRKPHSKVISNKVTLPRLSRNAIRLMVSMKRTLAGSERFTLSTSCATRISRSRLERV
jgi:hypothetical protein